MDANDGILLLLHALEAEEDDRIFSRWVNGPQMQMSFQDFKQALRKKITSKSTEGVLRDVEHIMEAFERERGE